MEPARKPLLTERVMDHVRTSVVDGSMVPDHMYSVYQLSEDLGISRTPVRDALLRLQDAGLVVIKKNRGFLIKRTRPEDVAEIFGIRIALEVPAARRAALWRADEFTQVADELRAGMVAAAELDDEKLFFAYDQRLHGLILDTALMGRGRTVIDNLRTNTRLLGASTAGDARDYSSILTEHDPIIGAVVAGDPAAAGEAMRAHLETTAVLLIEQALHRAGEDGDPQGLWAALGTGFIAG